FVSVASNGTLITRKVAERMKKIGVGYVEISLDHIDPKIHDEFRGVKGAWKRAVEGIKNCIKVGISTGMATTVTKHNYQSIPSMLEFAKKLGVDYFMAFNFVPTRRGKEISDYDLTPEERERLLELLYERLCEWEKPKIFSTCPAYGRISLERVEKGKGKEVVLSHFGSAVLEGKTLAIADFIGGCGAGRNYCSIEYNGDVQPCVFIPVKVGNVIKEDFEKIWMESEIFEKLRNRELLKGACGECKYKYLCGGCRARAFAITGDILDSDPGCIVVEEEVRR
ncbi:MAG TPA: SPASM domain-containing protein, partial [Candidatus Aenigmarchaeota archaeon]|nr:SPASM domain-containing protein [Candidatus Aenigmarchaeota archaeon]